MLPFCLMHLFSNSHYSFFFYFLLPCNLPTGISLQTVYIMIVIWLKSVWLLLLAQKVFIKSMDSLVSDTARENPMVVTIKKKSLLFLMYSYISYISVKQVCKDLECDIVLWEWDGASYVLFFPPPSVYTNTHTHTHTRKHKHTHTHTHQLPLALIETRSKSYMHACMHPHTQTHMRTYIHIHT